MPDDWLFWFRGDSAGERWYPETSESRGFMAERLPNAFPIDLLLMPHNASQLSPNGSRLYTGSAANRYLQLSGSQRRSEDRMVATNGKTEDISMEDISQEG